ncbi:hypothetical protein C8A05DRAFT_17295 [Staphylotrichum tortipilum]|uniref:Uncharacterized protein n=1 Tax=Staphylotrichum tortipilum TaxID=2831512 RepID=A0AAN6MGF4_9PEZI|nr:hypothetical protein C8A05DRAFT_17295 [Staphylotrichum longicolle]
MFRRTRGLWRSRLQPQLAQIVAEDSLAGAASRGATAGRTSQRVKEFAAASDIGFPGELRVVPAQNFKEFAIRIVFSPKQVFSAYHTRYLTSPEHPLTERILYSYTQQKSRPLWCQVQAPSPEGGNAVVRKTSERFVRGALVRALKAAGYDSTGKSLDGHGTELYGTIRVVVTQPKDILKVEFDHLRGYMTKLIAYTAPRLKRLTDAVKLP